MLIALISDKRQKDKRQGKRDEDWISIPNASPIKKEKRKKKRKV